MNHLDLITSIRVHLHDGDHLDAWELALEAQDAVAIAYVESHTGPIEMTSDPCGSCHGNGTRWDCEYCRPDGLCWETMIFVGDCLAAEWEPRIGYAFGDGAQLWTAPDKETHPRFTEHLIALLSVFLGPPNMVKPGIAWWDL